MELTNRQKERMIARAAAQKKINIPDFSKMQHSEVVKWAEINLKTGIEGIKGANQDFVKETVKVLAEFESKMGGTINGLSVKFGGLSNGVYAQYDDATKTVMLKKTGSIKAFEEQQKAANARYRIKWKRDKDYYATDTYSGTLWHEIGQSMSKKLGGELYEKSVKVSVYAASQQNVRVNKVSEAWAENFAAYMEQNKNASKVPDEIKEMIEDYFKKSIENSDKSSTIKIHKSLSAAAKNYQVKLMDGNDHTKLAENQKIQGKTFAGKGTKTEIHDRFRLESDYHIPADEW